MSGYVGQSILGGLAAMVAVFFSVRAFRRRRLTFSLLMLWLLIAALLSAAVPTSGLVRRVADRVGVSPSGLLLGIAVAILLIALFRLSVDVSGLRRTVGLLTAAVARSAVGDVPVAASPDRVAVILPALNEAATIAAVLDALVAMGHQPIVVDDGSTDNTAEIARRHGAVVLGHPTNMGVGAALRTGLSFASSNGFGAIVQCDADGQHNTSSINNLLSVLKDGEYDLVVGTRFGPGGSYSGSVSFARRSAIRWLSNYASREAGTVISDPTSGFRAVSPRLASVLGREVGDHYLADTFELIVRSARAGYRVVEAGTEMSERQGGQASVRGVRLLLYTVRVAVVAVFHLAPPFTPSAHSPDQLAR